MRSRRHPINPEYENYGLFAGCSRRELAYVTSIATRLDLPAGRVLAQQGDRRREFVIVVRGIADVTRDGRLVDRLLAGSHHGESGLVRDVPQPATVVARTRMTVDVIGLREFRSMYSALPSVRAGIDRELDRRTTAWLSPAGTRTAPVATPV